MSTTVDRRPYLTATSINQELLDEMASNLNSQIEFVIDVTAPDGEIIRASNRNKYIGGTFYSAILSDIPQTEKTLGEWLQAGLDFSTISIALLNVDGRFNKYAPGGDEFQDWTGLPLQVRIGLFDIVASYQTVFNGFVTDVGGFGRSQDAIKITARDRYDTLNLSFPTFTFSNVTYPNIEDSLIGNIIPVVYGDYTVTSRTPAMIPAFPVNTADLNVIGGPEGNEELTSASGKVAVTNNTVDAGDSIIVNTVPFTENIEWVAGVDTDATAEAIRVAINSSVNPNISGVVTASILSDNFSLIIITAVVPGEIGNLIPLALSDGPTDNFEITPFEGGFDDKRQNVQMVISENDNRSFDTTNVYYRVDANNYVKVPVSEISAVPAGNNAFELEQVSAVKWIPEADGDGGTLFAKYRFSSGDEFFCRVKGKDVGGAGYDENAVGIVQDILKTYGGVSAGDFDANFDTYRLKAAPAQSAIANIPVRAWVQEQQSVLEYTLQIFEQVRLEYFIERSDQKIKINAIHFEDISTASSIKLNNWDVQRKSLQISTSDTHFINQAQAEFDQNPALDGNNFKSEFYENSASIAATKLVAKAIQYPNLYVKSDAANQVIETLRLSSSNFEILQFSTTSRALLQDLGQFILFNVQIGSTSFDSVPCQIRKLSYQSSGVIALTVWSYLMTPYPGYNSGSNGIVGGFDASITLS